MSRILITILGTSNYIPCNYVLDKMNKVDNALFVQEALAKGICKNWTENDRIIIFLTEEAKKTNWYNLELKKSNGKPLQRDGLEKRLHTLEDISTEIITRDIPKGETTEDLWKIFQEIYNQINENDEVYLDITHAFRYLPMLVLIILNYAKVIKNIDIKNIYYGALESLGSIEDIKKMKIEDRNIPVFNLNAFIQLFEWTNATSNFLAFGDAKGIKEITIKHVTPDLIESEGRHQEAQVASNFSKTLMNLSENIKTCRLYELIKAENLEDLRGSISECKNDYIQPLTPLLDKIEDKIASFQKNEIDNGFVAVKWCIDHDLVQQGLTILQETIISLLVKEYISLEKISDKNSRNIVSNTINIKAQKIPENEWTMNSNDKHLVKQILTSLNAELVNSYIALSVARNDINHAGFTNPKSSTILKKNLEQYFKELRIIAKNLKC